MTEITRLKRTLTESNQIQNKLRNELTAERELAAKVEEANKADIAALVARVEAERERNAKLAKYVRHDPWCEPTSDGKCKCGLARLLEEGKEQRE